MFSSVETRYCAIFLISCIVLIHVVSVTAKIRMRPPPRPRSPPKRPRPPPRATMSQHRPADHTRRPDHNYNPSHHQPSAPKEPPHRPASANDHNQANPHGSTPGGGYPPWANPAVGPHAGPSHNAPGFSQPHGSPFQNGPHNPSHPGSSNGPYGNSHSYSPMPPHMGGQSAPLPGMMPNHHNLPPMGSHQNPAGYPNHGNQPYYAGPPMNQPYVPGQTTAFLPNQQSSGSGLGQLVKEAAVMSAVSFGVNKAGNALFSQFTDHKTSQAPAPPAPSPVPSISTPTAANPVINNNQNGPANPGVNGAASVLGAPSGSPGAIPSSSATGSPEFAPLASPSSFQPTASVPVGSDPSKGLPSSASPNSLQPAPVPASNIFEIGLVPSIPSPTEGALNPPTSGLVQDASLSASNIPENALVPSTPSPTEAALNPLTSGLVQDASLSASNIPEIALIPSTPIPTEAALNSPTPGPFPEASLSASNIPEITLIPPTSSSTEAALNPLTSHLLQDTSRSEVSVKESQLPSPSGPTNANNVYPVGDPTSDTNIGRSSDSGTPQHPSYSSSASDSTQNQGGDGTSITQPITETNNTANNETAVPAFQYGILNDELHSLTEILYEKAEHDVSQYVTLKLESPKIAENSSPECVTGPFCVKSQAYEIPTIRELRDIYRHYEFISGISESTSLETRQEENDLLDVFLNTTVMETTMSWLSVKGFIDPDRLEWQDTLRDIWMTKINNFTSGFERIFMAEKYDGSSVIGGQNWVYIDADRESTKRIKYTGYVNKIDLGHNHHLIKMNTEIDGVVKANTTILVGTQPELEMALYTICFHARPNDVCNVSLGGVKFNIYTHAFRYYGKDLIDIGLMDF